MKQKKPKEPKNIEITPAKFYLWVDGGNQPVVGHDTIAGATKEANRLSKKLVKKAYIFWCAEVITIPT